MQQQTSTSSSAKSMKVSIRSTAADQQSDPEQQTCTGSVPRQQVWGFSAGSPLFTTAAACLRAEESPPDTGQMRKTDR